MQRAATALMQGRSYQAPRISGKTIAEQIAERINNKLNYIPQVFKMFFTHSRFQQFGFLGKN